MNFANLALGLKRGDLEECLLSDAFIVPHNPYTSTLPHRTVFRVSDIDLTKWLRHEGYRVTLPLLEGTTRREVLVGKGIEALDLLVLFLVNLPLAVAVGIGSQCKEQLFPQETKLYFVQLGKGGEIEDCHAENGQTISHRRMRGLLSKLTKAKKLHRGKADLTLPIYLERSRKLVGHGTMWADEGSLRLGSKLRDKGTKQRVKTGELVGFSLSGISHWCKCSICGSDYATCPHARGKNYKGKEVKLKFKKLDVAAIAMVTNRAEADSVIESADL